MHRKKSFLDNNEAFFVGKTIPYDEMKSQTFFDLANEIVQLMSGNMGDLKWIIGDLGYTKQKSKGRNK